jgi:hypothetical protein
MVPSIVNVTCHLHQIGKFAPLKSALRKSALLKFAPRKSALHKSAPLKSALLKSALRKSALRKFAPRKSALRKFAPLKSAPRKSALRKFALRKSALRKFALLKSAPLKFALHKSALHKSAPLKSALLKSALRKFAPHRSPSTSRIVSSVNRFLIVVMMPLPQKVAPTEWVPPRGARVSSGESCREHFSFAQNRNLTFGQVVCIVLASHYTVRWSTRPPLLRWFMLALRRKNVSHAQPFPRLPAAVN